MKTKKALALIATACIIFVIGTQRSRARRWIHRILSSMDGFTIALSKSSELASRLSTDLQSWYAGKSPTSSNAAIAKIRSLLGDVKLQKYIGQIIAQSLDSWRQKTHMNENTELPPLADPLFYVPAAGGGEAAAAAAADADSTMAVVARALDVFSSSSGRSFLSVVTRSFSRELVAALLVINGSVHHAKEAAPQSSVLDATARGLQSFIASPSSAANTPAAPAQSPAPNISGWSLFASAGGGGGANAGSVAGESSMMMNLRSAAPQDDHHHHHHQQQQQQQQQQQNATDATSQQHRLDAAPALPPIVSALIPIMSSGSGLEVVRTVVHEIVDTAMPHLVPAGGGSSGEALTSDQLMSLLARREHRSLVCDVFEYASRGAAAAFIASSAHVSSGDESDAMTCRKHSRPVDDKQQQQQQSSNMLVMCALACVYELMCRHWKLAATGGLLLLTCLAVPVFAFMRMVMYDFHFEFH